MRAFLKTLVTDFGWIHRGIGMIGNFTFLIGSVLFLPRYASWQTAGVWLFVAGSAPMFVGAVGEFLVRLPAIRRAEG